MGFFNDYFTIKILVGIDMGFTDLPSKTPIGKPIAPSNYDEEFVVATISKINSIINPTDIQ